MHIDVLHSLTDSADLTLSSKIRRYTDRVYYIQQYRPLDVPRSDQVSNNCFVIASLVCNGSRMPLCQDLHEEKQTVGYFK